MSEDEFDTLPDVFEGVDWDSLAIPALSSSVPQAASPTPAPPRVNTSKTIHSPASSEEYLFEDFDQAFLDQVSAIEAEFSSQEPQQTGMVSMDSATVLSCNTKSHCNHDRYPR